MSKINNKKNLIIAGSIVVVIGLVASAYFLFFRPSNDFSGTAGVSEVNYKPPTKEEQASGNAQKEESVKQQEQDDQSSPAANASVFITDAGYYSDSGNVEIRAYVSNIYENGGQCKATLTQGDKTVAKTSTAFKDATTTQCGPIDIPRSEFPSGGAWNLTLTYSSNISTGQKTAVVNL